MEYVRFGVGDGDVSLDVSGVRQFIEVIALELEVLERLLDCCCFMLEDIVMFVFFNGSTRT